MNEVGLVLSFSPDFSQVEAECSMPHSSCEQIVLTLARILASCNGAEQVSAKIIVAWTLLPEYIEGFGVWAENRFLSLRTVSCIDNDDSRYEACFAC